MLLTPAQLTIIQNYVLSRPDFFAPLPDGSGPWSHWGDGPWNIARYLSGLSYQVNPEPGSTYFPVLPGVLWTPDWYVWRTAVSVKQIMENGFTWASVDAMTDGKARIWEWMAMVGEINPSKLNVRQGLQDAFGSNQPNIQLHLKRLATIGEKLLSTGTGSSASPAVMGYEGEIQYTDIATFWWQQAPDQ